MIGMTLSPDASLQCANDGIQNLTFYGNEISRNFFLKDFDMASIELHGICDAPESPCADIVCIRVMNIGSSINQPVFGDSQNESGFDHTLEHS